ncbi:MAG: 2-succinyl-5-enolpyruvyl-6-hydroxy-3-cyclohexene-1-carboxylic-acid synthase [Haloferacaceae archaeon]
MTAPNRTTLYGRAVVDELARGGVTAACVAPGSRSTPLTMALAAHTDIQVFSHLDERSAAFFALGRARRTGEPTPVVTTSGTAAANLHPAVVEASQARVPFLALTADRPAELRDSGANQTVDQEKLYGSSVRFYADLPEPTAESRTLRSTRTKVAQGLAAATGTPAGPVHLNCPFPKPLEPTPVEGDVPSDLDPLAADGRPGGDPFVRRSAGTPALGPRDLRALVETLDAERGLVVAGPADPPGHDPEAFAALAAATGFPILADPLSTLRYGGHVRTTPVVGAYDAYLHSAATAGWPPPDVVLRVGASPTSKPLRRYLAGTGARQVVVDPAGGWREAEFAATDLVTADPSRLAARLSERARRSVDPAWVERWERADAVAREVCDEATADGERFEGRVLATLAERAPDPSTLVVSNSMPVRDLDRFGAPSTTNLTVLANRGASGIDGVVSTALGAGSATTDGLTLVVGDLAFYHDMNGLLALGRCDVDATIVLVDNDGGGIFHRLPVEGFEPPFTEQFKTPHGLGFAPTGDLYDLDFRTVDIDDLGDAYADSVATPGSDVLRVAFDAESSHRAREELRDRVVERVAQEV